MGVVETNECCCCVSAGIMQNLPIVKRSWNILAVIEIDVLIIVVDIRELEKSTGSSVNRNVMT